MVSHGRQMERVGHLLRKTALKQKSTMESAVSMVGVHIKRIIRAEPCVSNERPSVITSAITGHERKSHHFAPARMSAPCASHCYPAYFATVRPNEFAMDCRIENQRGSGTGAGVLGRPPNMTTIGA